jgi:amidophosphoribosyltransferase
MSVDEICRHIEADSLGYLSLDGMCRAIGVPGHALCDGCFTGSYPLDIDPEQDKYSLEAGVQSLA